ncbi:hypothetical protein ABW387_10815 [Snodgrassella alvi]|uniref:hypothetical protein n=1 Tax=Snodgrassella alvi TaxID=1196083 RepID=UPI00351463AA
MKHNTDYKVAQKHILDAQTGYGSNGFPISPVIFYLKGGHGNKNWLQNTWECRYNYSSGKKKVDHGNTPYEGGPANYDSFRVSLRPISSYDNRNSDFVWGRFTWGGRIPDGKKAVIVPKGPVSFILGMDV